MNIFLLNTMAFLAVFSGILVITAKNPVISVLFLISVFINAAGYLVLLGAAYLGLAYLIIYVGAIAILFLFVIMMLNLRLVELTDTAKQFTKNLPLALTTAFLFIFEFLSVVPTGPIALFQFLNHFSVRSLVSGFGQQSFTTDSSAGENIESAVFIHQSFNPVSPDLNLNPFLQIESIGHGLYTYGSLWLIIASFIFLLAMVGPIVLCMNPLASKQ